MKDDRFAIVREDIHRRYGQLLSTGDIDRLVDATIETHVRAAKVESFLPVIVERDVTERLEELVGDKRADARPEVLFVDQRNSGRSQMASAFLRNLREDAIFSRSVGLKPTGEGIDATVLKVLADRGVRTDFLYQKEFVARTVHRADVVVLMGVDEIPNLPGERYVHWDIADPDGKSEEEVSAIADAIEAKVRGLVDELLGKQAN